MAARDESNNPGPLKGHIEIDETLVGGKIKGKGIGKGAYMQNKTTVFGIVERGGILRSGVVSNERKATLLPIIQMHVAPEQPYQPTHIRLTRHTVNLVTHHHAVNHNIEEWVRCECHTNSIEGFWSQLKRGIKNTHASVSPQHLNKYVAEFAFRYNNRKDPADMFRRVLTQIN